MAFEPRSPVWLWADIRSAAEARRVSEHFGRDLYARTGCPVHASYWPAKLLRWRDQTYAPFANTVEASSAHRLAGRKDYVVYRLTGEWVTDQASAAATGLYNSQLGTWDQELIDWLGLDPEWLPSVVPMTHQLALRADAAERLHLPVETVVVAGGLDGVLVHLGMGCAQEGLASCTIGTSGAVRMSSPQRITDTESRTWCYPVLDGLWLAGGAGNNGGTVLNWFVDLCNGAATLAGPVESTASDRESGKVSAASVIASAMRSEPGANGLLFMPYLFGERSPLWREELRGAFFGLTSTHTVSHMARAMLEGISLGVSGVYRALAEQIGEPREVRAGGGFVASPQWVQLQADVFGTPVAVTATGQETAAGAAMVSWRSLEGIPLDELQKSIRVTGRYEPSAERHELYERLYARMERLLSCHDERSS